MNKNNKKIILIFFLLITSYSLFIIFHTKNSPDQGLENNILNPKKLSYTAEKSETVESMMNDLQSNGKINFKTKTYTGMGKFVEEINGIKSDGENYWIYYINDKKANIGISNYKLNPGDIVSWKYEKNTY